MLTKLIPLNRTKNNNCPYKFVILLRHTFVRYRILDGRRSTDVNNVMHVKYSKVHDVHACLWKVSSNKTFIIWPWMLADKYHGQTNHVFLNQYFGFLLNKKSQIH